MLPFVAMMVVLLASSVGAVKPPRVHTGPAWLIAGGALPDEVRELSPDEVARTGAVCLDGTPPAFVVRRNPASSKWLITLQGGGWCTRPASCFKRSHESLGSSSQMHGYAGVPDDWDVRDEFSDDASRNPYMHDWNKAWLLYCDGGSFLGDREEPVEFNGHKLYMRGARIARAIVDRLIELDGLGNASHVLLTGCSAGGLAALHHADGLARKLPHAVVKVAPWSGWFLDAPAESRTPVFRPLMERLFELHQVENSLHPECLAAKRAANQSLVDCLFAQHLYPFVKVPVFVAQSAYDYWQMLYLWHDASTAYDYDLQFHCLNTGLAGCPEREVVSMNKFRTVMMQSILSQPKLWTPGNGCFIHSRPNHCGFFADVPLVIDGIEFRHALGKWFDDTESTSRYVGCAHHEHPPAPCTHI